MRCGVRHVYIVSSVCGRLHSLTYSVGSFSVRAIVLVLSHCTTTTMVTDLLSLRKSSNFCVSPSSKSASTRKQCMSIWLMKELIGGRQLFLTPSINFSQDIILPLISRMLHAEKPTTINRNLLLIRKLHSMKQLRNSSAY